METEIQKFVGSEGVDATLADGTSNDTHCDIENTDPQRGQIGEWKSDCLGGGTSEWHLVA